MRRKRCIAVFGGAFDPVHLGHLNTAHEVQKKTGFDHFYFLPCKSSLLKNPTEATAADRITMLELALEKYPDFKIDLQEITRKSPSYMVNTLANYRKNYPDASITLILGFDAFTRLNLWHQWRKIQNLAHLLVIERPNYHEAILPLELKEMLSQSETMNIPLLLSTQSGLIYRLDAGLYTISSTKIRHHLKNIKHTKPDIPIEVYNYIKKNKLYP